MATATTGAIVKEGNGTCEDNRHYASRRQTSAPFRKNYEDDEDKDLYWCSGADAVHMPSAVLRAVVVQDLQHVQQRKRTFVLPRTKGSGVHDRASKQEVVHCITPVPSCSGYCIPPAPPSNEVPSTLSLAFLLLRRAFLLLSG